MLSKIIEDLRESFWKYIKRKICIFKNEVAGVGKCPYCGFENEFKSLKMWKFKWWDVHLYKCPKCDKSFRYHVDPERKNFIMRLGGYA